MGSRDRRGGLGDLVVAGKRDLRARRVLMVVVVVPHGEVVKHHGGLRDLTSRTREVDREAGETLSCRRWRKGG